MSALDKLKFWKKSDPFGELKMEPDRTGIPLLGGAADAGHDEQNVFGASEPFEGMQDDQGFSDVGSPLPAPGLSHRPMSAPQYRMPPQGGAPPSPDMMTKDLEIISSKLDALRATLESINSRLSNLERETYDKRRGGW